MHLAILTISVCRSKKLRIPAQYLCTNAYFVKLYSRIWNPDFGIQIPPWFQIKDSGFQIPDSRVWIPDTGIQKQDFRFQFLQHGSWNVDFQIWKIQNQDSGTRSDINNMGSGFPDSGFWNSDFWIPEIQNLDSGVCASIKKRKKTNHLKKKKFR